MNRISAKWNGIDGAELRSVCFRCRTLHALDQFRNGAPPHDSNSPASLQQLQDMVPRGESKLLEAPSQNGKPKMLFGSDTGYKRLVKVCVTKVSLFCLEPFLLVLFCQSKSGARIQNAFLLRNTQKA